MRRTLPFRAILPENYRDTRKRYPVLYLLHGLFGSCDNWLELTDIYSYSSARDFIIVLPDGADLWYTDSATVEKDRFESSFIEEFIPGIDRKLRTIDNRRSRAVAGLSMGGFGALKFAFKRPDLFVFAGSMSGAFGAPRQSASNPGFDWENLGPSISKAFGDEFNPARTANDLFEIIENMSEREISSLPGIYIDCGTDDGFLQTNREFAELLEKRSVAFEYRELPGGHDWEYWNRQSRFLLEAAEKHFNFRGRPNNRNFFR